MSEVLTAAPSTEEHLHASIARQVQLEQSALQQRFAWFVGAESLLVAVYAFGLQKLADISSQEPGTYPRENIAVASLAWVTAWAIPFLALGLCVVAFLLMAAALRALARLMRDWRQLPHGPLPVSSGAWVMLLVPVLFALFWFFVVRHQSGAIQNGIEHWRNIPQDQA